MEYKPSRAGFKRRAAAYFLDFFYYKYPGSDYFIFRERWVFVRIYSRHLVEFILHRIFDHSSCTVGRLYYR